ncbi:MAG: 3-hydroxyacyl-CoA dehydrogenase [Paracoccaceae bacterium]|jgi:L-gulonate 3-dehydrogenase|tara:strand:- start:764 stop:1699 length:936 start_codon:yes stop_codon:yes gene_type:complete
MKKMAIIGCGLIGQGWAAVFARAGFDVALYDKSAKVMDCVLHSMETRICDLLEFELITQPEATRMSERIKIARTLEEAVDGAVYIQENGPEDAVIKKEITTLLDAISEKDVPICSSTSGISASRYCEEIKGRYRCLVVHPINPPHLIPAVEIVPSPWTSKDIVSKVNDIMLECRRETILLNEEIDGFVVNRLQGALLEEAFKLVGSGIVSAADLDKAICDGLGLRWSFMGPMQTIHLNAPGGIAQYVERYGDMYRNFDIGHYQNVNWASIVQEKLKDDFEKTIPIANVAEAQANRDRKLMALLRHKKQVRL